MDRTKRKRLAAQKRQNKKLRKFLDIELALLAELDLMAFDSETGVYAEILADVKLDGDLAAKLGSLGGEPVYWMLRDGEPFKTTDMMTWAKWFEDSGEERRVKCEAHGDTRVSTVFLAPPQYSDKQPALWETMVNTPDHDETWSWYSLDQAIRGHERVASQYLAQREVPIPPPQADRPIPESPDGLTDEQRKLLETMYE